MLFKNFYILLIFPLFLCVNSCSINSINSAKIADLSILVDVIIEIDNNRLSQIIKINIDNSLDLYNNETSKKLYILSFKLTEQIDSSFLTDSIRRISLYSEYKLYDISKKETVLSGSFNQKSSLGPITSLFSREQSERNSLERLAISISEEIKIRLIEWAIKQQI